MKNWTRVNDMARMACGMPDRKEDRGEDFSDTVGEDGDYEPGICPACNGSGEGQYDGTRCSTCKGKGEA